MNCCIAHKQTAKSPLYFKLRTNGLSVIDESFTLYGTDFLAYYVQFAP